MTGYPFSAIHYRRVEAFPRLRWRLPRGSMPRPFGCFVVHIERHESKSKLDEGRSVRPLCRAPTAAKETTTRIARCAGASFKTPRCGYRADVVGGEHTATTVPFVAHRPDLRFGGRLRLLPRGDSRAQRAVEARLPVSRVARGFFRLRRPAPFGSPQPCRQGARWGGRLRELVLHAIAGNSEPVAQLRADYLGFHSRASRCASPIRHRVIFVSTMSRFLIARARLSASDGRNREAARFNHLWPSK